MGTYLGLGTGRPKRRKRQASQKTKPKRRRRRPPPPVTNEVIGIRCRVYDVMLLDATLLLVDEVDGRHFEIPAVWLSVRREKPRVRRSLGTVDFDQEDDEEQDEDRGS